MRNQPLEDAIQPLSNYNWTSEDESDGERVNFDAGDEQDESDDESDFDESLYGDESCEDDKLFNENIDNESEWFRKEFESQGELSKSWDIMFVQKKMGHSDDDLIIRDNGSDDESFPVFNPVELYDPTFEMGMLFSTKKELRHAVHSHAIKTQRSINITKNDKIRLYAKCANMECGWKLHALKLQDECTFQVRIYEPKHTCAPYFHVKNLKSGWLSMKYESKFRSDPKRNVKGFRTDVMKEIKCHVSKHQAYKAKKKAILLVEGVARDQYSLLWDFAEEIKRTNPGSTVIIGTDDSNCENRFDRFYLCLQALKVGFRAGCRHFIGVDGCHLKGPYGGVLLSAVGVDPNNNNFPISFAVVNSESRDTWGWFLTLLKMDLNIERDYEWTFMSYKQKGLIQAFNEIFPNADHRFCVRHLHSNLKNAGFRGQAFKCAL
ncbi:uncharacterized protein [Henckelia pumila]|uniref:uncharacterized protein n=1 Tax=Henckelia pumila TaxID=405737 RepID=UPI003C6EA3B2